MSGWKSPSLQSLAFLFWSHPLSLDLELIDSAGLVDTSTNLLASASPVLGLQEHTIASGLCMTVEVLFLCVANTTN